MLRDEFKTRYQTIPLAIHRAVSEIGASELLAHQHREIELIYMRRGALDFYVDTRCYSLREGDLLFVPPYAIHRIPAHKEGATEHECICFSASLLCDTALLSLLEGSPVAAYRLSGADATVPSLHMQAAFSACERGGNGWELLAVGHLSLLFAVLKQMGAFCGEGSVVGDTAFAKDVIAFVEAHHGEAVTSRTIAALLYTGQSQFCRRFRSVFGTSFEKYLLSYRLERARTLLGTETANVTEIAYRVGFHNAAYFGKAFREKYGVTPLGYRKAKKSADHEKKV